MLFRSAAALSWIELAHGDTIGLSKRSLKRSRGRLSGTLSNVKIPGLRIDGGLEGLPWQHTRHAGVQWIDLAEAEEEPSMTVLIRMEPGRGYPAHRHVGAEDVLVLSGGYRDDDGLELAAGDFHRYPAGSVHAPVALGDAEQPEGPENRACVLFAVAHGGTELVAGGGGAR